MLALMPNGLASPFKKSFFAVLNSHSVQEHYQSDHAEKSRWRGFRSDGADRQADKEYGAAAQRKAADADSAGRIAEADDQEQRDEGL